MLDEKKTKKQLIDDMKMLREQLAFLRHRQPDGQKTDISLETELAWKDFLLNLHEKSFDFEDEELYRYILHEVVRLTRSDIGFLHLVSEDQRTVMPVCWHEKALRHCTASYETHYPVDQAGNWADCFHLKRPVVYNDFSHAPNRKGLPPGHNPIGRFMSVPVVEQGKVRIILGLGNKPDDYDGDDIFRAQLVANSLQSILTRRNAEKRLRENEERLSLAFRATRDGVWDWNFTGGKGYANSNYFAMLGMQSSEIPLNSDHWWRLVHPDDTAKVRQALDLVRQTVPGDRDKVTAVEFRMRKKTGDWCWILARGKVVAWDDEGRPVRMVGVHTDITERKQAEEALKESDEIFRLLFEKSGEAKFLMEHDRCIDCNEIALKMLGCTDKSRILNLSPADFSPHRQPDGSLSQEKAQAEIARAFRQGTNRFDWLILGFDGRQLYVDVILTPVTLKGRSLLYVTWRDVTRRRKAEEELLYMNAVYGSMQEVSPDGILIVNDEGRIVSFNARFAEISGIPGDILATGSNEEALAFALSGLVHSEDYFRTVKALYRQRAEKNRQEIYLNDGRVLDQYSAPIAAPGGKYYGRIWFFRDITESKRTEATLRQSEAALRSVFDASPVALCIMEGRVFRSVNKIWYDLFGYAQAEILGKTTRMLYENDTEYDRVERELYAHLKDQGRSVVRTKLRRKDGDLRDVVLTAAPLEKQNPFGGTVVAIEDVTERRQTEENLIRKTTFLDSLVEAGLDAILAVDENGERILANRRFIDLWRIPPQVLQEKHDGPMLQYVMSLAKNPDEFRDKVVYLYEHPNETCREEVELKDGSILDRYSAPVFDKDGCYHGRIWSFLDITRQKRTENELRESRRRLVDIIEFLPDATLVIDRNGKIIAWNRAMEVMTGVKKEDMLGKGNYEYAIPFYGTRRPILIDLVGCPNEEIEKGYTAFQRTGDILSGEAHTSNLPPGDIHVSATASVLRDSGGKVIAAIECFRDITERDHLEAQLRQAQKMEAIGTLAGGIAHDFNNILASTIGYTELATMNIGKPSLLNGYLEQVMKSSDRAKNLVNQILAFSRRTEKDRKPLDMTVLVKETLKLLRASLPETIKINHLFPAEPATIKADPTQIHQIVMNLCTNAAQAMRERGGEMEVRLSHFSVSATSDGPDPAFKAGEYVKLAVKDTGHGIDPAIIDKIFDPFFTTRQHQEGTGLGLSVVYGIVDSYGGAVRVTSKLGQGTTFNVYFPAAGEAQTGSERKSKEPVTGGTEALLLVDDEEPLVLAMEKYLAALGYDAVSSVSSPEALYMVQENPRRFDLMVTDMTMPHMTGLRLSRKVLAVNPLLPIILCTGYHDSITKEEAKRSGVKEFVLKPVSMREMAYLIRRVLDMRPTKDPKES